MAPSKKRKQSNSSNLPLKDTKDSRVAQINSVERLKKSSFVAGTLSLGYVLQINDDSVLVSLPGGMTGVIEYFELSDPLQKAGKQAKKQAPLSQLISIHQPIRCYTLGEREKPFSKKLTLMLSSRASLVNRGVAMKHLMPGNIVYGAIASKEDHGYVISTGIGGITCFLPQKFAPKGEIYFVGQPITGIIDSTNESARTITIKIRDSQIASVLSFGSQLSLNSLVPGMLVSVIVEKILKVVFICVYAIDLMHRTYS